jgi:hypothetical protein
MSESFISEVDLWIDSNHRGKVNLKWSYDLDLRSWGIKDMSVDVPDQDIEIQAWNHEEDEVDLDKREIIELRNVSADISGKMYNRVSVSLYPDEINVDTKTKKITVEFKIG